MIAGDVDIACDHQVLDDLGQRDGAAPGNHTLATVVSRTTTVRSLPRHGRPNDLVPVFYEASTCSPGWPRPIKLLLGTPYLPPTQRVPRISMSKVH